MTLISHVWGGSRGAAYFQRRRGRACPGRCLRAVAVLLGALAVKPLLAADPYAANNGLYPVENGTLMWSGPLRTLNFNYPSAAKSRAWLTSTDQQPLTVQSAPAYVQALKKFVAPTLRDMIERPNTWSSQKYGWYDMPWQAEGAPTSGGGIDARSGREAILASFPGQILPPGVFKGINIPIQNHTVVYYDALAATMLKKLWANPFQPDRSAVNFPEGAMVVKAAAVTATPEQWPVLAGSSVWAVWRPTALDQYNNPTRQDLTPTLVPLRVMQFDIIVKDSKAAPQTGWVFTTFVYNKDAPGLGTWDKLVPLGAQWGNDPELAAHSSSKDLGGAAHAQSPLTQTWVNAQESAPYALEQLGWGGRLSGPIDVAKRHQVIFTDGVRRGPEQRASSCMSCHGTAQSPFVANLYPSPNRSFPRDGNTFLLYPPGSPEWNRWFQNRSGKTPQNKNTGAVALDYDMLIMFALEAAGAATDSERHSQNSRARAH